jgi:hypothetical protein
VFLTGNPVLAPRVEDLRVIANSWWINYL